MRHVISLTTIPPRFDKIGPTLQSLLAQRSRPVAVELYIPASYRRFPGWGGALPEVPEGVTIRRVGQDLGPATKILPAARAWRGTGVELLYVDDDQVFAPNWAERSLALRRVHPEAAVCGAAFHLEHLGGPPNPDRQEPRAKIARPYPQQPGYQLRKLGAALFGGRRVGPKLRQQYAKLDRSGYADIAAGFGGVALRPEFLDDVAWEIPPVIWAVDDVWLSGHLARRDIPIWGDRSLNLARTALEVSNAADLYRARLDGADRRAANRACIEHMRAAYGIWGGVAVQST
jgi:hypothetical protein